MSVSIDNLGGNCPVQAEGFIDGKPFYFRARGSEWRIGIGGEPVGDPEWVSSGTYGDGPFDAGWMPEETARELIYKTADAYREDAARATETAA